MNDAGRPLSRSRRICYLGLCTGLALVLGFVEMQFPLPIAIPGLKLGLGNIVVLVMLYLSGSLDAFVLMVLKIMLSGFLFGNPSTMIYSASGAVLAYLSMLLCAGLFRLPIVSVSVLGALAHNVGQLCLAALIMQNVGIFYYLPFLMLAAAATGFLSGSASQLLLKQLRKNKLIE